MHTHTPPSRRRELAPLIACSSPALLRRSPAARTTPASEPTVVAVQEGPGKVVLFPAADPARQTGVSVGEKPHEIVLSRVPVPGMVQAPMLPHVANTDDKKPPTSAGDRAAPRKTRDVDVHPISEPAW